MGRAVGILARATLALTCLAAVSIGQLALPAEAAPPATGCAWRTVPTSAQDLHELALAATSPNDIWEFGDNRSATAGFTRHWDGTSWHDVPLPGPGFLTGGSAVTATDVWAVGGTGGVHSVPLFAHWNGLAWTLQTLSSGVIPASVSMVSSTDGWAAGNLAGSGGGTASDAALYHYDGVAWAPVSFPLPPGTGSGHLASIRALASDNAWAVGNWLPSGGGGPLPLVEHWDGTAWNLVSFPVPTGANIDLQTIDGVAGDLWVGGARRSGGSQVAFEAHGDGTTWSDVSAGLPGVFVQSTVRTSAADVWVSGYTQSPYMSGVPPRWPSVSAHWNGTSWTSYPPSDSNVDLPFTGILSFGATNAWLAVSGSNTEPGVTEHFSCPSAPGQPLPGANAPSGPTVVSGSAGAGANSPALPRAGAHTLRSTPMNLAGSFALALTVILALTAAVRLRSRHRS